MQPTGRGLGIAIGSRLRALAAAALGLAAACALAAPPAARAELPPKHRAAPKITGSIEDGRLLSVAEGKWKSATTPTFSYQWEVCEPKHGPCSLIPGADESSYRTASTLVGKRLKAIVTATTPGGSASVTSHQTKKILPGSPLNVQAPTIEGTLKEGATLKADPGQWAGSAPITYHYQWERCSTLTAVCEVIAGATAATYTLEALDVASSMVVNVLASNGVGSASASSAETAVIGALLPVNLELPSILGSLLDGQLLSAEPGSWSGTEPISFAYQWLECNAAGEECSEISKATGPTLKLLSGLIGDTVEVVVTATNGAGSTSVTSDPTTVVAGLLPSNTGVPSIVGTLLDGQLLSAEPGSWSGSEPISYAYQWLKCNAAGEACKEISKATGSTLELVSGLIGDTVKVVVTASNVAGSSSETSAASGLINGILPSYSEAPSIVGSLIEGQVLSATPGSWSGSEPISYAYQWFKCNAAGEGCEEISKATGSTLALVSSLIGDTVKVAVTATNPAGSSSATSSASGLVSGIAPSFSEAPSIVGSLVEGQALSATTGSWSGTEPISYAYQWFKCNGAGEGCEEISKATGSTLSLVSTLIGDTVKVVVTASNVAGSHLASSAASGIIAGIVPKNSALPSITGSLLSGQLLTAHPGTWSGSEPITYAYQWQLCNAVGKACANIAEGTGSTFKLVGLDVGLTLDVVTTAKNVAGSSSATSPVTGLIGL